MDEGKNILNIKADLKTVKRLLNDEKRYKQLAQQACGRDRAKTYRGRGVRSMEGLGWYLLDCVKAALRERARKKKKEEEN